MANATPTPTGARKAMNVLANLVTGLIVLLAIAMTVFTVISVTTFDRNDRDLFGYKAFIVRSDSMAATDFSAGDLVIIKEVDVTTLREGDIIAFRSEDSASYGETFTHKIRSIAYDGTGSPVFTTYGTTTGVDDTTPVTAGNVLGKYVRPIYGLGNFFVFVKTVPGYICCILLPFLALIIMQGITSVKLFRQYKEEQMAEINAARVAEMTALAREREQLAAEREQQRKMLEELQALKEQLNRPM